MGVDNFAVILLLKLQKTTRILDIPAMLTEWEDDILLDVAHLDISSRWVAPGPDEVCPAHFQCPFDGCEAAFSNASDCDRHVTVQKHPKKRQGDAKNWLCQGRHTRVLHKKKEMRWSFYWQWKWWYVTSHLLSNQSVTLGSWKFVAFMQLSED